MNDGVFVTVKLYVAAFWDDEWIAECGGAVPAMRKLINDEGLTGIADFDDIDIISVERE